MTLSNRYVIHTKISCFLEKGECCRRNHRWCSKPTNCDLRKSAIYVRYRCPTSTKIEKCRELLEKIPITNLFQHENRVSISRKREIWADSRTSITISTVKLHNVYAKTRNNNSSTTFVTIMSAFCPTSLFNSSLKSHVTFVRKDADRNWIMNYGKYARMQNLSNSSVWSKQLSGRDMRISAASRFVLPIHYILNSLHKILVSFNWNQVFISVMYPVLCFKYGCSRVLVTICAFLNKEQSYFKQSIWNYNNFPSSNNGFFFIYITECIKKGLLIQTQQWLLRSHKSWYTTFCLFCTEMAALMKTAYDGYRYIFYECAGKKSHLDAGHAI